MKKIINNWRFEKAIKDLPDNLPVYAVNDYSVTKRREDGFYLDKVNYRP